MTVRITLKLFAMLADLLPEELDGHRRAGNALAMDVTPGTTIMDLVERFRMPPQYVHLVLVDGRYVAPGDRATRVFADGEVLAIWPPIAGG